MSYMNPGRLGLIGAPTYAMLRDITRPALLEILSRNHIPFVFNKAENQITFSETGSRIIFRSLTNYERLRGTNLAWFCIDELTLAKQEAWERLEARLRDPKAKRRCGFAVWTPQGFDWVYKKFISHPVKDYHVTLAQPYENRHVLDNVPEYYERLKNSYDEETFKQEVLGQYLNVGAGMVYYQFNRNDHIRDLKVDPNLPLRWSLDFNVTPMCSVVCQTLGDEIRVLDEIVIKETTTDDAAEEFLEKYGNHHPREIVIYGDASGHARNRAGTTDYQLIQMSLDRHHCKTASFDTTRRNGPVIQRIRAVNGKLRNKYKVVNMQIDRKCVELIMDFEQLAFKDQNSREVKQMKGRGHVADALGYVVVKVFDHLPQLGPQPQKLPMQ